MKQTISFLMAIAIAGMAMAEDEKQKAASAKIVISGKPAGLVLVKATMGKETKTLRVKLLELSDKTKLAIAMPADTKDEPKKSDNNNGADPDLLRLLEEGIGEKAVAIEGRLSSTTYDVLIATVGGKGAKSVPLLLAERLTDLTAANAKDFPALGTVRVEGILDRNTTKVGKASIEWGIQNSDSNEILLLTPERLKVPAAKSRVLVNGTVEVIDGRFIVVTKSIDTIK